MQQHISVKKRVSLVRELKSHRTNKSFNDHSILRDGKIFRNSYINSQNFNNRVNFKNNKLICKSNAFSNNKVHLFKINNRNKLNYFCKNDWNKWLDVVKNFYKESSSKNNVNELFVKKPLDNRPYLSLTVLNQCITVMLDSGANKSVVGKFGMSLINSLKLKIHKHETKFLSTADGTRQKVLGFVSLPIQINNEYKLFDILVVPTIQTSFIFGSDFCNLFGIVLNYRKGTWECTSNSYNTIFTFSSEPDSQINDSQRFSTNEQKDIENVTNKFKKISCEDRLGRTNVITHSIDTGDATPFKQKQYLMSPFMLNNLIKELDKMLALDVVEPSNSSWCSPVLLVKKSNNDYRFCFDGRKLNSVTKRDCYPLPHVDRILNMLRDAKFISSIDLRSAFWQIPLDDESKPKTAFAVPSRGLFQFKVLPFGLSNSAQVQQRFMDKILGPLLEPKVFTYLDDIIVTSSTFAEHIEILNEVCSRLTKANLTINLDKCKFFCKSLKYLGFIVDENGLKTDPDKVQTMVNYARPRTSTEIKRFVAMCSWYRRFVPNFSALVSPLNDLIKGKGKRQAIKWNDSAESSFLAIKEALISAPILSTPDFSLPFTIQCDATNTAVAGLLSQVQDGHERIISFASRTLSKAERNYTCTERECLAVIFCCEKFRPYIEGTKFNVITDHYSLLWLRNLKDPTGRLSRWAMKLSQYDCDIAHRKGKLHVVADALSRAVLDSSPDINTLDFDSKNFEHWYTNLLNKVDKNPNMYPQWKIENNLLYRHVTEKSPLQSNILSWKLVVPKFYRAQILRECHDQSTAAHFGFYKTFKRVSERYYWSNMRKDILRYVKRCKVCNEQKSPNTQPNGLMGREKNVEFPWQIISVDLVGPLPRSSRGNKYLLVVADWLTKFTLLHPLREANASSIVKFMENDVFLTFGVPSIIICDNGTQFAGKVFKNLALKYKVQKIWYNARYHPQVCPVERINRIITTAIRSYIQDNHKDWDKEIKKITFAINTSVHEVTGFSPSFLNFGRVLPSSGDYYGKIQSTEGLQLNPIHRQNLVTDLEHLKDIFADVKNRLKSSYERNAKVYNLRRRNITFSPGDYVYKRNKVLSDAANHFAAKLAKKYIKCKVVRKLGQVTYELKHLDNSDAGKWHVKDLKPYYGSNSDVSVASG